MFSKVAACVLLFATGLASVSAGRGDEIGNFIIDQILNGGAPKLVALFKDIDMPEAKIALIAKEQHSLAIEISGTGNFRTFKLVCKSLGKTVHEISGELDKEFDETFINGQKCKTTMFYAGDSFFVERKCGTWGTLQTLIDASPDGLEVFLGGRTTSAKLLFKREK